MKKYLIGMIAVAGIILMMMCWYKESHRVKIPRYREVKMITWEKLDTFVLSNPTFKVEYPDNFVPDSSLLDNRNMRFDYSFAGCEVFLKCFSYPNDAHMDDSAAVEFSVGLRKLNEDSITLVDKHPGYFYLEGMDGYDRSPGPEQNVPAADRGFRSDPGGVCGGEKAFPRSGRLRRF